MKKLFALTAVSLMLASSSAFAVCPCQKVLLPEPMKFQKISYAAPVTIAPVAQPQPCCNNRVVVKKTFWDRTKDFSGKIYDYTVGPFFGIFGI